MKTSKRMKVEKEDFSSWNKTSADSNQAVPASQSPAIRRIQKKPKAGSPKLNSQSSYSANRKPQIANSEQRTAD
jgi:hypothetical protein